MTDHPAAPTDSSSRGWRPQFRLRTLLASTMLFSILFAVLAGLLRAGKELEGGARLLLFLSLAVAAPMAVMIAASLIRPARRVLQWWRQRRGGP